MPQVPEIDSECTSPIGGALSLSVSVRVGRSVLTVEKADSLNRSDVSGLQLFELPSSYSISVSCPTMHYGDISELTSNPGERCPSLLAPPNKSDERNSFADSAGDPRCDPFGEKTAPIGDIKPDPSVEPEGGPVAAVSVLTASDSTLEDLAFSANLSIR